MGVQYAQIPDILAMGKTLTPGQEQTAQVLLDAACSRLRLIAGRYGKDLDGMVQTYGEDFSVTLRSIIVQAVCRALDSMAEASPAISQGSQSGLGYSVSTTYLNPGQSLYFLRSELRDLGLLRQHYGALEVYGNADETAGG